MADPTAVISHLLTIIDYVQKATKQMRCNDAQCEHLTIRATEVLRLVKSESPLPLNLGDRLRPLIRAFSDLKSLVIDLQNEPLLKRLLWRGQIEEKIGEASRSVDDAITTFHLLAKIDLVRRQAENEAARRKDAEEYTKLHEQLVHNDHDILRGLGIKDAQIQDAMISINKRIALLQDTIERRFWVQSLHAMQRVSREVPIQPDAFSITSLEVVVHKDAQLGKGGYSTVFQGEYLGTIVAVKVIDGDPSKGVLQAEIDVWKKLRHPHILLFIGACRDADPPFIISEFKHNKDAAKYVLKHPEVDRVKILHEASLGLSYLHSQKVIHGDLKAANILIDEHGTACLADFGLSRIKMNTRTFTQSPTGGQPVGTPQWMAPEHMSEGTINKWTDIYSFGMTIYEIFTGEPPFATITIFDHLKQIVVTAGQRPSDPRLDRPILKQYGLDDNIWSLVTQCWDSVPENRPSTAELQAALKRYSMQGSSRPIYGPPAQLARALPTPLPSLQTSASTGATMRTQIASPVAASSVDRRRSGLFNSIWKKKKGTVDLPASQALTSLLSTRTPSPFDVSRISPTPFPSAVLSSGGMPLDISLRLRLLHLPLSEQASLHQFVPIFAETWEAQYPGLMEPGQARMLAFHLIFLNMDYFRKDNPKKPGKEDFIRERKREGFEEAISEYFFDNVTFAPFLYQQDLALIKASQGILDHTPVVIGGGAADRMKTDERSKTALMYSSLTLDQLAGRRADVDSHIPESEPFSAEPVSSHRGQSGEVDVEEAYMACLTASSVEVVLSKDAPPTLFQGRGKPVNTKEKSNRNDEGFMMTLRKVGRLERKNVIAGLHGGTWNAFDDKWVELGVALTANQLLFFIYSHSLVALKSAADSAAANRSAPPRRVDFKPDDVISLEGAIALYDASYPEVFRLVPRDGPQSLFRVPLSSGAAELDKWISAINYSSAFRTYKLPLRPASEHERAESTPPLAGSVHSSGSLLQPRSPRSPIGSPLSQSHSSSSLGSSSHRESVHANARGNFAGSVTSRSPPIDYSNPCTSSPTSEIALGVNRIAKVQRVIEQLQQQIEDAELRLKPDLRTARTLAILTPFLPSTREKIQRAVAPLAKRVRETRVNLARNRCYRDVLIADLAAERRAEDDVGSNVSEAPTPAASEFHAG